MSTELRVSLSDAEALTLAAALEQYPKAVMITTHIETSGHEVLPNGPWRFLDHKPGMYMTDKQYDRTLLGEPVGGYTDSDDAVIPIDGTAWHCIDDLEAWAYVTVNYYATTMPIESAPNQWTVLSAHRYGYYPTHHVPAL